MVKSCRNGINSYTSSSELDAQHVLPHQTTIKRKKTTPGRHVPACSPCHVVMSVLTKVLQKWRFLKFCTAALERADHWGPWDIRSRRTSQKRTNGKANCCTLLRWITELKCVNSEVKSVSIYPTPEVASEGPMAPCRSHHRNHTRQEWIIIWSDRNWILKHANQPRSLDLGFWAWPLAIPKKCQRRYAELIRLCIPYNQVASLDVVPDCMPRPPALELGRERTKKEKGKVLHLFRCYTHTRALYSCYFILCWKSLNKTTPMHFLNDCSPTARWGLLDFVRVVLFLLG